MSSRKSRVCLLTSRVFSHRAFMGGIYDGEDVLLDIDDVDLISLEPGRACQLRQDIQQRIAWHDFTRTCASANMAFKPTTLTQEYDLFVAYFPFIRDLIQVPAVRGWKDRCRTSVCWIDEIYAADIPRLKYWLSALMPFDHVVVGYCGTVGALAEALQRPCHWLPIAVDAIRFSPYPNPPDRVIDIYRMGSGSEGLHQALLNLAEKTNMFYLYDTFVASDIRVHDHRQHRRMLANMVKRSRYFIVAPTRRPLPDATGEQIEVGLRYFEGSAAGAVMIGQNPSGEAFDTLVNWHDAVVEVEADGSNVADVIAGLEAQPERLSEINRRNAIAALLQHDWTYRWKRILEIAGLEPAPQLEMRQNRLKQLAEQAGNGQV